MKIATTMYDNASEYTDGIFIDAAANCEIVVARTADVYSALKAKNAAIKVYLYLSIAYSMENSKTQLWGNLTDPMIFADKDTGQPAVVDSRYLMDLGNSAYFENKIAEIVYYFQNSVWDGFFLDMCNYVPNANWNITASARLWYTSMMVSFIAKLSALYPILPIWANCAANLSVAETAADGSIARVIRVGGECWELNAFSSTDYITWLPDYLANIYPTNRYYMICTPTPWGSIDGTLWKYFLQNMLKISDRTILLTPMYDIRDGV